MVAGEGVELVAACWLKTFRIHQRLCCLRKALLLLVHPTQESHESTPKLPNGYYMASINLRLLPTHNRNQGHQNLGRMRRTCRPLVNENQWQKASCSINPEES